MCSAKRRSVPAPVAIPVLALIVFVLLQLQKGSPAASSARNLAEAQPPASESSASAGRPAAVISAPTSAPSFAATPAITAPPFQWSWSASPVGDLVGNVAWGDVNGDGRLDLLLSGFYTGAKLYLNKGGTLGYSADWISFPPQSPYPSLIFPGAFTCLSDINQDGRLDLVAIDRNSQYVLTYLNNGHGFPSEYTSRTPVTQDSVNLPGQSNDICTADLDGDGDADLVVSFSNSVGVFRNEGGTFTVDPDPIAMPENVAGVVHIALGDIDGDGYPDLAATTMPHFIWYEFGAVAGGCGDFNGDGFDDLIVGAEDTGTGLGSGASLLFLGGPQAHDKPDRIFPAGAVAPAGDVNGDGYSDFMVGPAYGTDPVVHVFLGSSAADSVPDLALSGSAISSAPAGDLNGDGFDDMILNSAAGQVLIFFGGAPPDTTADLMLKAPPGSRIAQVAGVGDVNADGHPDIAVSTWNETAQRGQVLVFFAGGSMDSTADLQVESPSGSQFLGCSISPCGDFNGDHINDFMVGDPSENTVYVYFGGPSVDAAPDLVLRGSATQGEFGVSLSGIGDINSDGSSDIAVTAYLVDADMNGIGSICSIFLGGSRRATGDARPDMTFTTSSYYQLILSAGDFDGDGADDFMVTDPMAVSGRGRVSVYRGGPTLDTRPDFVIEPPPVEKTAGVHLFMNQGGHLAHSPAWTSHFALWGQALAIGDMNGDGRLDLVCTGTDDQAGGYLPGTPGVIATFLNTAQSFGTEPSQKIDVPNSLEAIDIGDLDNDGDLDVVGAAAKGTADLFMDDAGHLTRFAGVVDDTATYAYAVRLADVDDDGDLDYIAAAPNNDTPASLYLNQQQQWFNPVRTWESSSGASSVVAADVNLDGFPDLAFAGYDSVNAIYFNQGGSFPDTPDWTSSLHEGTRSIALARIDHDQYPDLVCGGYGGPSTIYTDLNLHPLGIPSWTSSHNMKVNAVAASDLDRDGSTDLVFGTDRGPVIFQGYSNGTFVEDSSWTPKYSTGPITIADLNQDGRPELVCVQRGHQNTAYLGIDQPNASREPFWTSGGLRWDGALATSDFNRDGFVDLLFGSSSGYLSLYLNQGGRPAENPSWQSRLTGGTTWLVAKDLNNDGYDDVIARGGDVHDMFLRVHMNRLGDISPDPDWSGDYRFGYYYSPVDGIAVADLDNDGDYDLVDAYPRAIHFGTPNPAYKGDFVHPTNQLLNNTPVIRNVIATDLQHNEFAVRFTAYDVESDPIWVYPEYRVMTGGTWSPLLFDGQGAEIGPLPTSPEGKDCHYVWNVPIALPLTGPEVQMRLRWTSNPTKGGQIQRSGFYLHEMGTIQIYRPVAQSIQGPLVLPAVTLGDTVAGQFTIWNRGNVPLSISGIRPDNEDIDINAEFPISLDPGAERSVSIKYVPVSVHPDSSRLHVMSNDPLEPDLPVELRTRTHDLESAASVLHSGGPAPIGENLTVSVIPGPEVRLESGYLYFKRSNASAFTDSVPLSPMSTGFFGIIPGATVTEVGVDYYVRVKNSGFSRTLPAGAPAAFYHLDVQSPAGVAAVAQQNSVSGFLAGSSVNVQLFLPNGAIFDHGTLHYRRGGETGYQSMDITPGDPVPSAMIPDSLVGVRGVEYWAEVQTAAGSHLTDPAMNPAEHPRTVQTTIRNLEEPMTQPGMKYRMFSLPLSFGPDLSSTIEAFLADQHEFGPYSNTQWRCFRYLPELQAYAELGDSAHASAFMPGPGRSFWLISRSSSRVNSAPLIGFSTPTDSAYVITLHPGWNQVADPFAFAVAWTDMLVGGVPVGDQDVVQQPIGWDAGAGAYRMGDILTPFTGYWIRNMGESDVRLMVPPREAQLPVAKPSLSPTPSNSWKIPISAAAVQSGCGDAANIAGVDARGREEVDGLDVSDPPLAPGHALSVYFPHANAGTMGERLTVDMRPELSPAYGDSTAAGEVWSFDVTKNFADRDGGDEILLTFGTDKLPASMKAVLIDRVVGRSTDLLKHPTYTFLLGQRDPVSETADCRFTLVVGSDGFVNQTVDRIEPVQDRLLQNSPNPFRTQTVIRYELAKKEQVTIRVFDVTGRLVRSLDNSQRDPGRHEAAWDGLDDRGVPVAPGIYYSRLQVGDKAFARSLVRLR